MRAEIREIKDREGSMKEEKLIKSVCEKFCIAGEYKCYETVTSGHINTTYRVYFLRDGEIKDYILQRVNTYVFRNPIDVIENISSVTEFIRDKIKQKQATAKRNVLHYSQTLDGKYYTYMDDGISIIPLALNIRTIWAL